jgi:hypothetical protein
LRIVIAAETNDMPSASTTRFTCLAALTALLMAVGLAGAQSTSGSDTDPHRATPAQPARTARSGTAPAVAGRPWLGVRIVPVPAALAAHLYGPETNQVFGNGVMVQNIVTDGPADKGGLNRYDVIVGLAEKPVGDNVGDFAQRVGQHKAGDRVSVVIVRRGRLQRLWLTLGEATPANAKTKAYKYTQDAKGAFKDTVQFSGGILRRSADGWQWQQFGQDAPTVLDKLPADIREHVEAWTATGIGDSLGRARVTHDGKTIEVSRDPTGVLLVRRWAQDELGQPQQIIARTYTGPEALAETDAEAYAVYESLPAATDPATDVMAGQFARPAKLWDEVLAKAADSSAPRVQFMPEGDGKIRVQVRRADGMLVMIFDSAADLAAQRPELYQQYEQLTKALD